jgi:hypothetical protein
MPEIGWTKGVRETPGVIAPRGSMLWAVGDHAVCVQRRNVGDARRDRRARNRWRRCVAWKASRPAMVTSHYRTSI